MTAYEFDRDMMETIFQEIAMILNENRDAEESFVGCRCSNKDFAISIASEVNDAAKVVTADGPMPYVSVAIIASMCVEWMIWMRQNGLMDV